MFPCFFVARLTTTETGSLSIPVLDFTFMTESLFSGCSPPKFGQSWLGGQTTNKVEATNMPIGANLDDTLEKRTPPPSVQQAPMPQPPPGVQQSSFYSPQELSIQKMGAAVEMLQALGPIQQQQALETEKAKLAMQPEKFSTASQGSAIVS